MNPPADLARTALQLLFLGALIFLSVWIVEPFLPAFLWATTIAVATWPVLLQLQTLLGGRRSAAVAVMTVSLLLLLVVPLYFGIDAIVTNASDLADWASRLSTFTIPAPPAWLDALPLVGTRLTAYWRELQAMNPEDLPVQQIAPFLQKAVLWFVSQVGSVGGLMLEFLLTVILSAILYSNGEAAAEAADQFARRIGGEQGSEVVVLAGQAVRGVALGVVVTALVQSVLAGVGLMVVGVPFASVLTVVLFMLCIAQIGAIPILLPAIFWVFHADGNAIGTVFLVWSVFVGLLDNFLRPALIKRGAPLPLLLIFSGVIGGLIAFGIIGLFIGPVVLAVAYTLLVDWVEEGQSRRPPGRLAA